MQLLTKVTSSIDAMPAVVVPSGMPAGMGGGSFPAARRTTAPRRAIAGGEREEEWRPRCAHPPSGWRIGGARKDEAPPQSSTTTARTRPALVIIISKHWVGSIDYQTAEGTAIVGELESARRPE